MAPAQKAGGRKARGFKSYPLRHIGILHTSPKGSKNKSQGLKSEPIIGKLYSEIPFEDWSNEGKNKVPKMFSGISTQPAQSRRVQGSGSVPHIALEETVRTRHGNLRKCEKPRISGCKSTGRRRDLGSRGLWVRVPPLRPSRLEREYVSLLSYKGSIQQTNVYVILGKTKQFYYY